MSYQFPDDYFIIDVGSNHGEDSFYYTARGFKVLAFEANPELVKELRTKASDRDRDIEVVWGAISNEKGDLPFYVNTNNDVWSSLNRDLGARRSDIEEIFVPTCNLTDRLAPIADRIFYVKIDIEGADFTALEQITRLPFLPNYVSVENGNRPMIELLARHGYSQFKFYNQKFIPRDKVPSNSRMGKIVDYPFSFGSSGLFGEDISSRWVSYEEALKIDKALVAGREAAPDNLFAESVGWFDMHARLKQPDT